MNNTQIMKMILNLLMSTVKLSPFKPNLCEMQALFFPCTGV